jgi:alkanesulfonate monooxygenase SsuD/methylene tetrahydromethanopterin reductase-like flavin-dependent oxidoreductase (luciferase family)
MRIDLIFQPHWPASEMTALGQLAERYGIHGVWVSNHLQSRDPFVNFVPLALGTSSLRMGPTALSPFELHPVKMANALLTLNELSGGRAQIAVGGGGGSIEAMGIRPVRMVRAVRECVEMLRLACSGQPGPYRGELFRTHWLDASWSQAPAPDLYVAANGEQMLRMAARVADGIMVSDFTAARIRWCRGIIDPVLQAAGRDPAQFPLVNFWAWHVKESRAEAEREALTYFMARGTIWEPYIHDVVDADEAALVIAHQKEFVRAYQRRSAQVEGVPEALLRKLVDRGVSAAPAAEIDREIDKLRALRDAGLTGLALCLYGDPAYSVRLIGERVLPALR